MTHSRGWAWTVVLTLLLWAGEGRAAGDRQDFSPKRAQWKGWVEVAPVTGRAETLVSIDLGAPSGPDGQIDHAVLIQSAQPLALDIAGPGLVSFDGTTLTVEVESGASLSFSLSQSTAPTTASASHSAISVWGLSHYWGASVALASPGALAARLSPPLCSVSLMDATTECSDCTSGGPGEPSCSLEEVGCSADCSADAFPCCTAGIGCRCCKYREAGGE